MLAGLLVVVLAAVGAYGLKQRSTAKELQRRFEKLDRDFNEVSDRLVIRFREVIDLSDRARVAEAEVESAEIVIKKLCSKPELRAYLLGEDNGYGIKPVATRYLRMAGLVT